MDRAKEGLKKKKEKAKEKVKKIKNKAKKVNLRKVSCKQKYIIHLRLIRYRVPKQGKRA